MRLSEHVRGAAARFRAKLGRCAGAQLRQLESILNRNGGSAWGRRHGFGAIRSYAEFARALPVSTYSDLAPWIERVAAGEPDVLACGPVVAFEETGGSSGGRKLVPHTAEGLAAFHRGLAPWLDDLFQSHPQIAEGTFYWAISPAGRAPRRTAGGIPIGLPDAAYFGEAVQQAVLDTLAVPPALGELADMDEWRRATLAHLLARRDLTLISVWSPTFLTELLRHAGERDYAKLWPRLRVISCWDQAAARPHAERLRALFPGVTVQGKGLLATEGLVTMPLAGCEFPVLALESGFWEFVDEGARACMAHEVRAGGEYALLMTTHAGLYRYAIGDRVKVRGFAQDTPLLEFIGRGDLASDLCGEKLTEDFVAKALTPLRLQFAMLSPARHDRRYLLLLDAHEAGDESRAAAARRVERALRENPQYSYARSIGQLGAVRAVACERPLEKWIARGVARGQRLADIKLPALAPDAEWSAEARR
jgi:hypothetical protein